MGMKSSIIQGFSTPVVLWKTIPGDPYTNGDVVTPTHGSVIMISVNSVQSIEIDLPPITAASAGRVITVINQLALKDTPGLITIVADDADTVEGLSPLDFFVSPSYTVAPDAVHFYLTSDGDSRWNFTMPYGGDNVLNPA